MWVPTDATEIEEAAARGDLEETSSFDGKLDLPAPKKNINLAIDVAAMTTEGGVLLYGIGEDDNKRLTVLQPLDLAGVAERIDQIVSTAIAEVPYIEVKEHRTAEQSSKGYVSVLVPQSARAPHQVIVGDDRRYYGRGAKGNRRLSEGEVAQLYRRRGEWEQDRDALLAQAIAQAPFSPEPHLGFLHGFARPVAPDRGIWDRAVAATGSQENLREVIAQRAAEVRGAVHRYRPLLRGATWIRNGADEWQLTTGDGLDRSEERAASYIVDVRVNVDGRGHLFCGRAAERIDRQGPVDVGNLLIFEPLIAGNFRAFLAAVGALYEAGGYHGHVDVGLAVTGIAGGITSTRDAFYLYRHDVYNADTYPRHGRLAAAELLEPEAVTLRLLRHLFEATTGVEDYDPFEQVK